LGLSPLARVFRSEKLGQVYKTCLGEILSVEDSSERNLVLKALAEAFGKELTAPGAIKVASAVARKAATPPAAKEAAQGSSKKKRKSGRGSWDPEFVRINKGRFDERAALKKAQNPDKGRITALTKALIKDQESFLCAQSGAQVQMDTS